jgi:hypothetical protein
MLKAVRNLLKRSLSPSAYHFCSTTFWTGYYYWPHLVASHFVRKNARVRIPPGRDPSELVNRLSSINVYAPTGMCRVMTKYGSDKGNGWHTYTPLYSALLESRRNQHLQIFELGLGTNNPRVPQNMGPYGRPGASLRGWRELFPSAMIYGADVDRSILFEEQRIKTFFCDQLDSTAIRELWSQPMMRDGMDIIIEDGLHTFDANMSFLEGSLQHLRPDGIYVIEDIAGEEIERWYSQLSQLGNRFPDKEFALVEMKNSLNDINDNNALIVWDFSLKYARLDS